jgi:hypothetical protein
MHRHPSGKRRRSSRQRFILLTAAIALITCFFHMSQLPFAAQAQPAEYLNRGQPRSELVIYPAPQGAPIAQDFRVKVNQRDVAVYDVNPDKTMGDTPPRAPFALDMGPMTYFDFEGRVTVEITANSPIRQLDIRPKSLGLKADISGNRARIVLDRPVNFGVEINGNQGRPLFIFANALERDVMRPGNTGVVEYRGGRIPPAATFRTLYFGPGIHDLGRVELRDYDNKTFYVAGGAIVRGGLLLRDSDNVTIRGRGIWWNSESVDRQLTLWLFNCNNVNLDGITVVNNAPKWTMHLARDTNVTIQDVKVLSSQHTGDGLDPNGSQNVTVNRSFFATNDDAIAIKSDRATGQGRASRNITIQNSTLWFGTLDIGLELHTNEVSDITVRNLDIVHKTPRGDAGNNEVLYRAALKVNNSDRATVRRILFDNVRIEHPMSNLLVAVRVFPSYASTKPYVPGRIDGVRFRNIQVIDAATVPPILVKGYGDNHQVENISFEDVTVNGTRINNWNSFQFNEFVEDVELRVNCCRTIRYSG